MEDRRQSYRVDTSCADLRSVHLCAVGGGRFECRLVDASASGASVAARRTEGSELDRNRPVRLEVVHPDVPEPVFVSGVVEHAHLYEGYVRYGIRFTAHDLESVLPGPVWRTFNRRGEARLAFGERSPVQAVVSVPDGDARVEGAVRDVSATGIRVALPAADCAGLGHDVKVAFRLGDRDLCFAATPANVEQTGFVVEMGLGFDAARTREFERQVGYLTDFLSAVLVDHPRAA